MVNAVPICNLQVAGHVLGDPRDVFAQPRAGPFDDEWWQDESVVSVDAGREVDADRQDRRSGPERDRRRAGPAALPAAPRAGLVELVVGMLTTDL